MTQLKTTRKNEDQRNISNHMKLFLYTPICLHTYMYMYIIHGQIRLGQITIVFSRVKLRDDY